MGTVADGIFSKWRDELAELEAKEKRKYVPEEWEGLYQALSLTGGIFGIGGLPYAAVCLKCGAMVYPTALDRHSRFHEQTVGDGKVRTA